MYHDAPVAGSIGSSAPGMSFHRKCWNVRAPSASIGNFENTAMPNWPGNAPKPSASSPPPIVPLLLRSNPEGMPVFDGAVKK